MNWGMLQVMNLIGDVEGKTAVMVDDMIDTAGTITKAAQVLHEHGIKGVIACASHAVFSPPAIDRLSSGVFQVKFVWRFLLVLLHIYCHLVMQQSLETSCGFVFEQEVIVTNTIPVRADDYFPELTVLSVANLLGETIWRVHDDSSVSDIFG